MAMLRRGSLWLVAAIVLVAAGAQQKDAANDPHKKLLDEVAARILAVAEPVEGYAWPPIIEIAEDDQINAYATLDMTDDDEPQPRIFVYRKMMEDVIQGDEDRLAYLLGHELAHILHKHVDPKKNRREDTPLIEFAATREQEKEADLTGLELALKAGYTPRRCLGMIERMLELGLEYTSFEGLQADHPSWQDRLAYIDEDKQRFWRAMSAFSNGVYFLMFEQYPAAQFCFQNVVNAYPDSAEAWANLGYARLMEYCDALRSEDLERFDIGPLVVGGFYTRPGPQLRDGPDEELWYDAVGALREALRLDPDTMLAAANLGVAYLLHFSGNKDVGQAMQYFDQAARLAANDEDSHPLERAAVFANVGVGNVSAGQTDAAEANFEQARTMSAAAANAGSRAAPTISATLAYHEAVVLSASRQQADQRRAVKLFEQYLQSIGPASAWWQVAYDRYASLCSDAGVDAQSEQQLQRSAAQTFRPVTTITLASGATVTLSQRMAELEEALGEGDIVPVARRTLFKRAQYPQHGLDLLITDLVLAIWLTSPDAPPIELRAAGVATDVQEIRVGMSRDDLEEILGDLDYDYRQLYDPEINYRFYRDIGLAVRIKKGEVIELIVAQIPERQIR